MGILQYISTPRTLYWTIFLGFSGLLFAKGTELEFTIYGAAAGLLLGTLFSWDAKQENRTTRYQIAKIGGLTVGLVFGALLWYAQLNLEKPRLVSPSEEANHLIPLVHLLLSLLMVVFPISLLGTILGMLIGSITSLRQSPNVSLQRTP